MAKDVTSLAETVGGQTEKHMLSARYNGDAHLAVVRQTAAWNNKELVVVPASANQLFAFALAWGNEAYPTAQGGSNVYNDTNGLVSAVDARLASATWSVGQKAVFSYFCRTEEPHAVFVGASGAGDVSGHGRSVVALKYNLRGLPLAKMSAFSAYVRAYVPSLVTIAPDGTAYAIPGAFYNSASTLDVRLTESQPSVIATGTEAVESFEVAGNCNDGLIVTRDTAVDSLVYDPLNNLQLGDNGAATPDLPTHVYRKENQSQQVVEYYHDFELAGDCKTFLAGHMGEFWMAAAFRSGNAFASGTGNAGLAAKASAMVFAQRLELILKCTSSTFN